MPHMLVVQICNNFKILSASSKTCTLTHELHLCRQCFPQIVATTHRLIEAMKQQGPNTEFDMDKMAQRLTVDVIGRFGFDRDFGATNITQPCEAVEVIRQLTGAMQSRNNPLNRWFPWRKVSSGQGEARPRWPHVAQFGIQPLLFHIWSLPC